MKNWKIKFKLFGLSSVLTLGILFISVLSLILMADLNEGTTVVSANWLPSVIIAEELNTATSDFRIAEASHVISQDDATMQKHESTLNAVKQDIESMFSEYSTNLITNETDKALLERAQTLWSQYLTVHNDMIAHSRDNDTVSAMYSMEHESEVIFDEVSSVFLELVEFNKTGADSASLEGDELYHTTTFSITFFMILSVVFAVFTSIVIINGIVKPVEEIEHAASEMLKGELSTEIYYSSSNELGNLASSMSDLCHMFKDMIMDLSHLLEGMADGDFTVRSDKSDLYVGDFEPLLTLTNGISERLSQTLAHINLASEQVFTGSQLVADSSQLLAKGASEQATSIDQLSETLRVMEGRMEENAENAVQAKNESVRSKQDIEVSSKKMENMLLSMDEITERSNKIGDIIKAIEDIAFQTNILALNASVEAARAGTAGKGFAVVADEVRNLSEKSSAAAKDTAHLIEETLAAVQSGSVIAKEAGTAIDQVVDGVQIVTDLVDSIYQASQKQKVSVAEISTEVSTISNVINSNSTSTEETAAVSEELSGQASELKALVAKFRYSRR